MRRLVLILALIPALASAQIRSWEKYVAPGLVYRMEMDLNKPLTTHVLRWSPKAQAVTAKPELAGATVFSSVDGDAGRETVGTMAARTGAIAGINCDFFPWNGDPLGAMMKDGQLLSMPARNRAVFGWGKEKASFARLESTAVAVNNDLEIPIKGLNEECGDNMVVLNTHACGATYSKEPSKHVVLSFTGVIKPNTPARMRVETIAPDAKSMKVDSGKAILTGRGKGAEALAKLKVGMEIKVTFDVAGADLTGLDQMVGGGPMLVTDGKPDVSLDIEGFKPDFSLTKHPRTAIGQTADGDVLLVIVDGRQDKLSGGISLPDLADLMIGLGCVSAMNCDGGGSSNLVIFGASVNRPSDGEPRPVANGLLLFGAAPFAPAKPDPEAEPEFVIQGRSLLTMGLFNQYKVVDRTGQEVPNIEVIWSSTGTAWVDQGGYLRGVKPGASVLRATVRGLSVEIKVTVEEPVKTPPPSRS